MSLPRILVIGGSGYVGRLLRPMFEQQFDCRYLDLKAAPGQEDRTLIGSLNDESLLHRAIEGVQAICFLAVGLAPDPDNPGGPPTVNDIDAAFEVNVKGVYRVVRAAMAMRVHRMVYASSMSVYQAYNHRGFLDETTPADSFDPYGFTKFMGEHVGQTACLRHRRFSFVALRMVAPRNEADYAEMMRTRAPGEYPLAPNDTRRLFLAALQHNKPGAWIMQATGDVPQKHFSHARAREVLDWSARGE